MSGNGSDLRYIGKPVKKKDAFVKVTGQARYTADLPMHRALTMRILRSPVPHARIRGIDVRIHWSWLIIFWLITSGVAGIFSAPNSGRPWCDNIMCCNTRRIAGDTGWPWAAESSALRCSHKIPCAMWPTSCPSSL